MKYCTEIGVYISPNYIVTRDIYEGTGSRSRAQLSSYIDNFKSNKPKSEMSTAAQKKIKKAINWLVAGAKEKHIINKRTKKGYTFKVNFITLTIHFTGQAVSAAAIKKDLLNPWLTMAKYKFKLKNYVWKLELTKNKQPHIHLTTDTYIHWKELRNSWNKLLSKKGYLDEFAQLHYHYDANSTDVHSVKKVKDIAAYVAKYVSKAAAEAGTNIGRIWGCNYELSKAIKTKAIIPISDAYNDLKWIFDKRIKSKEVKMKTGIGNEERKVADVYLTDKKAWKDIIRGPTKKEFDNTIFNLRTQMNQPHIILTE